MPHKTYLQSILNCFTSMDIDGLHLYLKAEYSYQDTTKEIFLNEIEEVFKAHKNSGDTELLIYKGACAGKECDNCGKKGYRFVGDHSKNYIDLLFVIIDNDIRDIFDCAQFETEVVIDCLGTKANLHFNLDDRITFNKTPEYWAKVFSAINAYSELISDPPKRLDFEEMCYWLDKHADSNDKIGNYDIFRSNMKWTPFSRLYNNLKEFKSYISGNLLKIKQANYSLNLTETEDILIEWVQKYEAIYEESPFDFKYPCKKENGNYIFSGQDLILFTGEEFTQTINFVEFYKDNYNELLDKYTTYTNEEVSLLFNYSDLQAETSDILSLKFHLERRKELEDLGKNIPLYINQENNKSEVVKF